MAKEPWVKAVGLFGVIVTDIIGYTGAGFAIGYFAWKKAGFPEWFPLIPTMLGFGLAMYKLYRLSQKQ
jgi:F0F1-type ATP synthase assembly protein I